MLPEKLAWHPEHEKQFQDIKSALTSESALIPYLQDLPLHLHTNASDVGIGAVLTHPIPEGDRPVAFY